MNTPIVIIPTYNERENITAIAEAVLRNLPQAHLLIVDDNSPDGTGALADALALSDPRIRVLHRPGKEGLGRAYVDGFRYALNAGYAFIIQMDADFSHNPTDLPRLLAPVQAGEADISIGSRYIGGSIRVLNWPMHRLLLSTGAGRYVRLITGMPVFDPTGGYKCFRASTLAAIDLTRITSNGYSFQIETTHAAWITGHRVIEVPIVFADRAAGTSKMHINIAFEAFRMVLSIWARNHFRRSPHKEKA